MIRLIIAGAVLATLLAPGAPEVSAQGFVITDEALRFTGNWGRDRNWPRGNCGGYRDERGNLLEDCSTPIDKLPMNDRARAWLRYFDELQSPHLNECASITVPNLLGDVRPFNISFKTDSVIINYEQMNIFRYVWMDGRKHPPATDLFQQGHAVGRWEGKDLVFETTNFTWDPEGIDDHLHFPSSTRKKVIERYRLLDDETMQITITLEDPVFLTQPFTYVHQWKRYKQPLVGWWECDPESMRNEMQLTAPVKYPGSVEK